MMDQTSANFSYSYSFPNTGLPQAGKTLTLIGSYPGIKIQNFNGSLAFGPNTDLTNASFDYSRFLWHLNQDLSAVNMTSVNIFSTRVEYGQAGVTPGGYREYEGRDLVNLCETLGSQQYNTLNYRTPSSQTLPTTTIGAMFARRGGSDVSTTSVTEVPKTEFAFKS